MSDYITIPLSKRTQETIRAIVDSIDADLDNFNWSYQINRYAIRKIYVNGKYQNIHMHRVILSRKLERELLPTEYVDHINGNGLDNRRENLRLATKATNGANRGKPATNTSGYKGVSWHKRDETWQAFISVNGKRIHLGCFDTPELANEAVIKAREKYHGEFANHGN